MSHDGPNSSITGSSGIAGKNAPDCDDVENAQARDGIVQGRVIRLEESVLEVQSSLGLTADGMLGPNTSLAIARQWGDVTDPNVRAQLSLEQQAAIETIIDQIGPGMFKQHRPEDVACVAEQDMDMDALLPSDLGQHPEGGIAGIDMPTHVSPADVSPADGGIGFDDVLGAQPGLAEVEAAVHDGTLSGMGAEGQVIADAQMPTHETPGSASFEGLHDWGPVEMPNYTPDVSFDNLGPVEMPNYIPDVSFDNLGPVEMPNYTPDVSFDNLGPVEMPNYTPDVSFDNLGPVEMPNYTPEIIPLPDLEDFRIVPLPYIIDGADIGDGFITQFADAFSGPDATVSGDLGLASQVADSGFTMDNLVSFIAEALNINMEAPTTDARYDQSFTV